MATEPLVVVLHAHVVSFSHAPTKEHLSSTGAATVGSGATRTGTYGCRLALTPLASRSRARNLNPWLEAKALLGLPQ
jgi:hypothetical protein